MLLLVSELAEMKNIVVNRSFSGVEKYVGGEMRLIVDVRTSAPQSLLICTLLTLKCC